MEQSLRKVHLIAFLDSLSFGLIFVFIKANFLNINGSHLHIGLYTTCIVLAQLLASDVRTKLLAAYGTKNTLILSLTIGTVSNLIISSSSTAWLIILLRCIFVATNHTGKTLKETVLKSIPEDLHQRFTSRQAHLNFAGLLLGPIIAGYLLPYGFYYSCLFASLLAFINLGLVQSLPIKEVPVVEEPVPLLDKTLKELKVLSYDWEKSDWKENWDLLAMQYLFTACNDTFFTKFNLILLHNYHSTMFLIGCTVSFIAVLNVIAPKVVKDLKSKYSTSTMEFVWYSLATMTVLLVFASYSPELTGFLSALIPLIAFNCYLSLTWPELFAARENSHLSNIQGTVGTVANLTMPILIGVICDVAGHHAVIFLSVVPIMYAMYIFGTYTSQRDESVKVKGD